MSEQMNHDFPHTQLSAHIGRPASPACGSLPPRGDDMFHSFRDAAMAGTVKLVGAVLLATLIVATLIRAATAADPFKFDVAMKNCDDINKTKPGSCKKTSTKTKVIRGCFKSQNVCFVCLNGKCYSATGETKTIKDNHGKSFVVGVNGVPHHPLQLRREPPATNGDLIEACS